MRWVPRHNRLLDVGQVVCENNVSHDDSKVSRHHHHHQGFYCQPHPTPRPKTSQTQALSRVFPRGKGRVRLSLRRLDEAVAKTVLRGPPHHHRPAEHAPGFGMRARTSIGVGLGEGRKISPVVCVVMPGDGHRVQHPIASERQSASDEQRDERDKHSPRRVCAGRRKGVEQRRR